MPRGNPVPDPCANFHSHVFVTISDVKLVLSLLSAPSPAHTDPPQRAVFQYQAENSELA